MANGPDLNKMDLDALKALAKDIDKAIVQTEREQLKKARAAAEDAAKKFGFTLDEIVTGASRSKPKTPSTPPKYRNPDNTSQTWSGRGRQPEWFKAALAKGKTPEDMAV